MNIPIFQVDAFTEEPFKGNPAGVCLLRWPVERGLDAERGRRDEPGRDGLPAAPRRTAFACAGSRPRSRSKLCGHATLATAHILWETGPPGPGREARFQTLSGLLTARARRRPHRARFPGPAAAAATRRTGPTPSSGPWGSSPFTSA
ncbi:MAG: PhzF family phenazine biosynthesis protein [Ignavibacteriales bacterium]|nr:PhzF family phenazine biosynthesis protein [Ignavibacteriales bacterium]